MDFKEAYSNGNFELNHYHQNYGYDLEGSLAKHPIKELENEKYKDDLVNLLKKEIYNRLLSCWEMLRKSNF